MYPYISRKNISISISILTVFLVLGLAISTFLASGEVAYYVSPLGSDINTGTIDQPLKTIEKARDLLRANKPSGGATVYLREGEYDVNKVTFTENDSGFDGAPIVYKSYPDETAIIDGTVDLPTPTPVSVSAVGAGTYVVDMSKVDTKDFSSSGMTDVLMNGELLRVARYPNYIEPNFDNSDPWAGNYLYTTSDTPKSKTQLKYESLAINPNTWSNVGSGAKAVVFSGPNYWDSTVGVSSVDSTNKLLKFSEGTSYEIIGNNRFYVENSREFLDKPGEWFYDKDTDKLFVYLENTPTENDVFSTVVAGDIFDLSNVSNIAFEDLVVRGSAGAAFHLRAYNFESNNVTISGNDISVTHREGIRAWGRTFNLTIDGNNIHDTGWGAVDVKLDERYFKTLTSANNLITNNTVTRTGRKWRATGSGMSIYSIGARVSNNEIHSVPREAIVFRGNDNIIEFNKVYDTNLEVEDTGAIYTLGRNWLFRGNIVRNNYVKNVGGYGFDKSKGEWVYPYYSFGIYLDDFASDNVVENNVVEGAAQSGIIIHGGREVTVENNFVINSYSNDSIGMIGRRGNTDILSSMWDHLNNMEQNGYDRAKYFERYPNLNNVKLAMTDEEIFADNKFTKNIVYNSKSSSPHEIGSRQFAQGQGNVSNSNVFWSSSKNFSVYDSYLSKFYNLDQWRDLGFDADSVFGDPLFSSLTSGNFTFSSGSPAIALGISPINALLTGPQTNTVTNPIITISNPKDNDSLSAEVVFSAIVTDTTPIQSVDFSIDGTSIAKFTSSENLQKSVNTKEYVDGTHTFKVMAINQDGGVNSAEVTFSVSNSADEVKPSVTLLNPPDGSRVKRNTKVSATASDNVGVVRVEFYLDGLLIRQITEAPYEFNLNTRNLSDGEHTIYAIAYDAANNFAKSETHTVTKGGVFRRGKNK